MIRRFALPAAFVAAALLTMLPRGAAAQSAQAVISSLGNEAIQVLGPGVPEAQRLARFRELFRDDFDLPEIGRFVLGRYWRTASPDEQQEFLRLFQEYIVRAYSARLGQYAGEPFRVLGARPDNGETVVTSQIVQQNGQPISVDWYLLATPAGYKITDVYVGGVSMAVTERDEFASVIERSGGVAGLLAELRQKLSAG
ncbi:MAG TPA: ABC transporter substrate-binding protein [Stellaceae bacterium]|nr:ABC transporter substrate-binding protein [Stellaceae bacterium]